MFDWCCGAGGVALWQLIVQDHVEEGLVDQLFNSSEKRLARILLLMAEFGKPGEPETLIPPITQETLAEMIGTTRSQVSFFMNRFRKLGFIEYNGRIRVHKSLPNVILHDQPAEQSAEKERRRSSSLRFLAGSIEEAEAIYEQK
jgi:Crp-like helix-turn-helix domain